MRKYVLVSAGALAVLAHAPLPAYIERMYSLQEVLDESTNILVGKIEKVDRKAQLAVAAIEKPLKGKKEYTRVQMNIGLGPADQGKYLMDQWVEGETFLLYYSRGGDQIASVGHAGDTWFQLYATHEANEKDVWWRFTHLEIYMGRTFNGGTNDLVKLTEDVLAKRRKPPPPDPRVPTLDYRRARRRAGGGAGALEERVLVASGSEWRYFKGAREAASASQRRGAWRAADFDDRGWASGPAPFGYGDEPLGTPLPEMRQDGGRPGYASLFLRRRFEIADAARVREAEIVVDYDDGFIAWINGVEVAAANRPEGEPGHNSLATGNHESGSAESFPLEDPKVLRDGENVIAVQVFNQALTSSDLKLDLELRARVAKAGGGFRRIQEIAHAAETGAARGLSWVDVNGDDALDLHVALSSEDLLLINEGESFKSAAAQYGLRGASRAAAWVDFDGDDHPDVLRLKDDGLELLSNAGGRLRPVELPAPLSSSRGSAGGWIDHNGDGRPDLLIARDGGGLSLFESAGGGPAAFREVSGAAGLGPKGIGAGKAASFALADYDGDGYTDVFLDLDRGLMARNQGGGGFKVEAPALETAGGAGAARAAAFADFDNDGDFDLVVPAPARPRLYRNQNDGSFADVTDRAGDLALAGAASIACAWGDLDHDGFLDLLVCRAEGPISLYFGDGKGGFRDGTAAAGLGRLARARAASFADLDGDGDLDLALDLESGVLLAANELPKKPESAALLVRVRSKWGRAGCVLRAADDKDRPLGTRELSGGAGRGGEACPVAHFALPAGRSKVSAILSDGRVAMKTVELEKGARSILTLKDGDFEK
jgi:hypothetical protein